MKLSSATFNVIDTETTGLDPKKDRVIEIAVLSTTGAKLIGEWSSLINPRRDIPALSSAIHHIIDDDVEASGDMESIVDALGVMLIDSGFTIAAHVVSFDHSFLPFLHKIPLEKCVCTKRMAQHLWPDAPGYGNQVLRYWLNLDVPRGTPTHRAAGDTLVTSKLLQAEIETYLGQGRPDDLQAFVDYCWEPLFINKMPRGKHYGVPLREVPQDYLKWASRTWTETGDEDLLASIKTVLGGAN